MLNFWVEESREDLHKAEGDADRQLAQANGRLQEAERRLKEVTEENYQLKVYLSSKNCGRREDFARFKQRPRFACTVQPICTGIKRQTDGGPIFIRLAR